MTVLYILIPIVIIAAVLLLKKKEAAPATPAPTPNFPTGPIYDARVKFPKEEAGMWMYNYAPGGMVFDVGETGSMKPWLDGSEFVVAVKNYGGIKLGDPVAYLTVGGSSPAVGSRLLHRIVDGNGQTGWIPKGDTPGCPAEDWNPITPDNYVGTVVAVFRPLA